MDVSKINSLVELYFKKVEQIDKKKPFLKWLNPKNNHQYNWEEAVSYTHLRAHETS